MQVVGDSTLFAELNGGAGIKLGKISITDSNGVASTLDLGGKLNGKSFTTVGDVSRPLTPH